MEDPLIGLKRISNPSTIALYTLQNKRILLLGDMHIPNARDCSKCVLPNCGDYLTLIDALDNYHKEQGTELDVFLETFAPEDLKSGYQKTKKVLKDKLTRVTNRIIHTKGLHLVKARNALDQKVFFHGRNETRRYHTFDLRKTELFEKSFFEPILLLNVVLDEDKTFEPNVHKELLYYYPTKESLYTVTTEMCFSEKQPYNRIAKQVYKLDPKDQLLVKRFFKRMFDHDFKLYKTKRVRLHFVLSALMTDIYAISRFLRFHRKQPQGSTSVFLAGFAHTWHYALFLKDLGAKKLFDNHPGNLLSKDTFEEMHHFSQCQRVKWKLG